MTGYRGDCVVLALPRGGVPVGYEVARRIGAPLDVFIVRKLGVPGHPELAMGAIASGGTRVLNQGVIDKLDVPPPVVEAITADEMREVTRREVSYRGDLAPVGVAGRSVILVDDGLATGASMRAAIQALRGQRPAKITVAVPTGSPITCRELSRYADEVICAIEPADFYAVGQWYEDFTQTEDAEVQRLLRMAREESATRLVS
ncbi:MAG: phosphoribosyltransferase [Actinomycetota bacterium]